MKNENLISDNKANTAWLTKNKVLIASAFLSISIVFFACRNNPTPEPTDKFEFVVPKGWPQPVYNFENNPLSKNTFELGRKIFYDERLSSDGKISCGTCHQQFSAFAQLDHNISHGVDDKTGTRNSPPIFNMNWHTSFFWDGRVNHIESQPINPLTNPVEMNITLEQLVGIIDADTTYKRMFKTAFGDEMVNTQRIFKSLAQFMGMMVSSNSKFDKYKRGETTLTQQELAGYEVYKTNCSQCHTEPLFTDFSFRNNGLPFMLNNDGKTDSGRAIVPPFVQENMFKFKIPSLRNLKYTFPYMHDGRINTLEQVLDHYANINPNSENLDPILINSIPLNNTERSNLLAFLNTLNDEEFVKDTRFAAP